MVEKDDGDPTVVVEEIEYDVDDILGMKRTMQRFLLGERIFYCVFWAIGLINTVFTIVSVMYLFPWGILNLALVIFVGLQMGKIDKQIKSSKEAIVLCDRLIDVISDQGDTHAN